MYTRAFTRIAIITLVFATSSVNLMRYAGAADVEFIVGDYMPREGGRWRPENSRLRNPFGVDFDSAGNLYVVELNTGRLHQRLTSGEWRTLRETHEKGYGGDGGTVAEAQFNGPHNCVVTSDDKLLIADSWNHCVREVDLATQLVQTLAGTGEAGYDGDGDAASKARFNYIMCIELNPEKTRLHIADLKNRRIRDIDLTTGKVTSIAGNGAKGVPHDGQQATAGPLVDPRAVASDHQGNVYVLERGGHALRVVRPNGTIHTVAGNGTKGFRDGPAMQAQFASPKHICCDPKGNVYIADDQNGAIRRYDPTNEQVTTLLGRGFGDAKIQLKNPHGVRWRDGMLYVTDTNQHRLLRLVVAE